MKKIYLALMCMVCLALMTACGGQKGEQNKEAEENVEAVENEAEDEIEAEAEESAEAVANPADAKALDLTAIYANGDFKPAKDVVFEDNFSEDEDGELPSKWELKEGSVEVKECAGRNVLSLGGESSIVVPLLNGKSNFLTDTWNLEYEYFGAEGEQHEVRFMNNEDGEMGTVRFTSDLIEYHFTKTDEENLDGSKGDLQKLINKGWNHVAVSFNKGNVKIFINGKRIFNLPNVMQPSGFRLWGYDGHYFANIRVTK